MRRFLEAAAVAVLLGATLAIAPATAGASPAPADPSTSPCLETAHIPRMAPGSVASTEKKVTTFVGQRFGGIGSCGNGLLLLTLTPGSEATARRVRAMFGPSILIVVGWTMWNGRPERSPRCGDLPAGSGPPTGYTATLHLDSRRVTSGHNFSGVVSFRNTGDGRMQLNTGEPLQMEILKPGTRLIVGTYFGGIAGVGQGGALAPGESYSIPAVGGTARCDGGLGSALPPGRYTVVAEVAGGGVSGPRGEPTHLSSVVPVEVVAR
jgi:hypothetical protein